MGIEGVGSGGDEGVGRAGEAGGEELLIIAQCPMPHNLLFCSERQDITHLF